MSNRELDELIEDLQDLQRELIDEGADGDAGLIDSAITAIESLRSPARASAANEQEQRP